MPDFPDPKDAERMLDAISQFACGPIPNPRIQSIRYMHNGQVIHAEVGKELNAFYKCPEKVMAILLGIDGYMICTLTHGAVRGAPILVGNSTVHDVRYFDSEG